MHELSRQVEIESHKREIVADTLHGQEGVYKLSLCADQTEHLQANIRYI